MVRGSDLSVIRMQKFQNDSPPLEFKCGRVQYMNNFNKGS